MQTELSVPLYWGLVPEELKSKVAANLAKRIEADSVKLDVGLLGTKAILNALSENGYAELAYKLAARKHFHPGVGGLSMVQLPCMKTGPSMQSDISMNHIMFGEIGAWMYKALGGIKPDP